MSLCLSESKTISFYQQKCFRFSINEHLLQKWSSHVSKRCPNTLQAKKLKLQYIVKSRVDTEYNKNDNQKTKRELWLKQFKHKIQTQESVFGKQNMKRTTYSRNLVIYRRLHGLHSIGMLLDVRWGAMIWGCLSSGSHSFICPSWCIAKLIGQTENKRMHLVKFVSALFQHARFLYEPVLCVVVLRKVHLQNLWLVRIKLSKKRTSLTCRLAFRQF